MPREPDTAATPGAGATPAPDSDHPEPASPWSRARQDLAIVLWPSFLAGAVATMCFFALFDPSVLAEGTPLAGLAASHNAGYALGFFFWLVAAGSSALTIYLARTQHPDRPNPLEPWLRDKP